MLDPVSHFPTHETSVPLLPSITRWKEHHFYFKHMGNKTTGNQENQPMKISDNYPHSCSIAYSFEGSPLEVANTTHCTTVVHFIVWSFWRPPWNQCSTLPSITRWVEQHFYLKHNHRKPRKPAYENLRQFTSQLFNGLFLWRLSPVICKYNALMIIHRSLQSFGD